MLLPWQRDVTTSPSYCYVIADSTPGDRETTGNELDHVLLLLWLNICFKIVTRYTCGFFPRILAIIPATRYTCVFCHVYLRFISKYMTIFLQTRIYMRTKKPRYIRYKQACGICGRRKPSYKRHRIIPSEKNPFMYDGAEK